MCQRELLFLKLEPCVSSSTEVHAVVSQSSRGVESMSLSSFNTTSGNSESEPAVSRDFNSLRGSDVPMVLLVFKDACSDTSSSAAVRTRPSSADWDDIEMLKTTLPGGTSAMSAILPASDAASLSSALSPPLSVTLPNTSALYVVSFAGFTESALTSKHAGLPWVMDRSPLGDSTTLYVRLFSSMVDWPNAAIAGSGSCAMTATAAARDATTRAASGAGEAPSATTLTTSLLAGFPATRTAGRSARVRGSRLPR
mmetsp:Transcript_8560/g.38920  ORF Transcript_8560/g.38920 Transcript_8560/m.38920 type:complete len:254 (+) Transcript_8560:3374-4135(+)